MRWILAAVVVVAAALYIGLPFVTAVAAVAPGAANPGEPPDGFSYVALRTADNVKLAGWYAEPRDGVVIIVVHGAGSGRDSVRRHVEMLHNNGFGVLAINMRGYGDSEGRINRLGWMGTLDVGAAIAFLETRPDIDSIGALGLSMGGEILLGAASTYPQISAIVADGATSRGVFDYIDLAQNQPFYRSFSQHVFTFFVRLISGQSAPEQTLLESIRATDTTSFLFVAAGNVDDEAAFGAMFRDAVPNRGDLWIISGVDHTAGLAAAPADYEARVVGFFRESLR